jgi:hypothetical protein
VNLPESLAKTMQEAEDAIIQTNRAILELDNDSKVPNEKYYFN